MSSTVLQDGQKLTEHWEVEYTGKGYQQQRDPAKRIECRVVKMYHSTIYGGSNGTGATVEEARLNAVLGLARAICNDGTAFNYDADEIFKGQQLRWFESKRQELQDELSDLESEFEQPRKGSSEIKKVRQRIKQLEQLQAEWQDEHDYWPAETEETNDLPGKVTAVRSAVEGGFLLPTRTGTQ